MGKRRKGRFGVLIFAAVAAGAVAITMAFGWCAAESYTRTDLLTGLERQRPTTCGFVRGVTGGLLDWVPCQFWNLMPLTLVGVWALGRFIQGLVRARE